MIQDIYLTIKALREVVALLNEAGLNTNEQKSEVLQNAMAIVTNLTSYIITSLEEESSIYDSTIDRLEDLYLGEES